MEKKTSKCVIIGLVAMQTLSIVPISANALAANDDWNYVKKHHECEDVKKRQNSKAETPSGANGDWLTEGSDAYVTAKEIFRILTEEYGTSGAFAAGVLASVRGESNFIPDILEGGQRAGMDNPEGSAYNSAKPNETGGGGLFQFTPYTKFVQSHYWRGRSGSSGWDVGNQVDAVWGFEFGNRAVEPYFSRTGDSSYTTVEQLIATDDPAKAALYFQMAYERPQSYHPERSDWACQANAVFNKDNIKADKSKWRLDAPADSGPATTDSKSKKDKNACSVKTDKAGWGDDGTGTHNYANDAMWKPTELPDDLKKYAIDPESLGMSYGSATGWPNPGDQCAHFSESLFSLIWTQDGSTPSAVQRTSFGKDEADSHAAAYGGSVSKSPMKGAVAGQPPSQYSPVAGHTYIVSHTFENGDILIIEQNMAGMSGAAIGQPETWNYRIITKDRYTAEGHSFYSAEKNGYKPNSQIKMMGS